MPKKQKKASLKRKKPIKQVFLSVISGSPPFSKVSTAAAAFAKSLPAPAYFTIHWNMTFNEKSIWKKVVFSLNFDFQTFHVFFFKQAEKKAFSRKYNLIKHSSKTMIFCKQKNIANQTIDLKNQNDWNAIMTIMQMQINNKQKNVIIQITYVFENKSMTETSFVAIEFLL